jgi:hypothetical protein
MASLPNAIPEEGMPSLAHAARPGERDGIPIPLQGMASLSLAIPGLGMPSLARARDAIPAG